MAGRDPDQELWSLAREGQEDAYARLRRKYQPLVLRQILRLLGKMNSEDRRDLEQDIWIAVWRSLGSFRGHACFKTWILAVAKNTIHAWLRRKRIEVRAVERLRHANGESVDSAWEKRTLDRLTVREAVRRLASKERDVLALRYYGQFTDSGIARQLRVPLGTVKGRLRAGLRRLLTVL